MAHTDAVQRAPHIAADATGVLQRAVSVRLDDEKLCAMSQSLIGRFKGAHPPWDAEGWHYTADASVGGPLTAQYMLVLDALNFCFWPSEHGFEYVHLACALRDALLRDPAVFDAARLAVVTPAEVASWFPAAFPVPDPETRAAALNEVGAQLGLHYGGSALRLIHAAAGSAVALVGLVAATFPRFRDEAYHAGHRVGFYKRAQIFVADVSISISIPIDRKSTRLNSSHQR